MLILAFLAFSCFSCFFLLFLAFLAFLALLAFLVVTPSSEEIMFSHKNSACGGKLDVDKTQSSNQCVENVVWQNEPPVGQYSVFCNNYNWSNTANPTGRKKDFDVGITVGSKNEPLMLSCEMPPQSRHKMKIATFNYDQKKNMDVIWSIGSK